MEKPSRARWAGLPSISPLTNLDGAILVAGCVLRVSLALVNRAANDDHLIVATWIRDHHWAIPNSQAFQESFHAKGYHFAAAVVFELFSLNGPRQQILAGNMLNVAAGMMWLLLMREFLKKSTKSNVSYLTTLGFCALCPAFVTIQAQATNDAFVILFSTAMIYWLWRYVERPRLTDAVLFTLFAVLAASSKVTGWVGFFSAILVICVEIAERISRGGIRWQPLARLGVGSSLVFLGTVPFEPPYSEYIRDFGSPFTSPWTQKERQSPPKLFEETPSLRPGIRSTAEGFGTFRLLDMIETPYIGNDQDPFPTHRTSFWSQIFGRMSFARFDQWPPQWQATDGITVAIGRIAIVVGLLPAAVFLLGFTAVCAGVWPRLLLRVSDDDPSTDWMFLAFCLAFFCMLIKVTWDGRQYSWMKPIYVFPGSLGLCLLFARGVEAAARRHRVLVVRAAMLSGFIYIVDMTWLIYQLAAPSISRASSFFRSI